jgi:hypothetical protein
MRDRRFLAGAAALALLAGGCGGSSAPPVTPGTTDAQGRSPVLGEDAMKAQMEKLLQKKGPLPKGLNLPKGARAP